MPYFLAPLWKTSLDELTEEQLWEHYETCLKAHDWYYNYSDDGGVFRAGEEQYEHIDDLKTKLMEIDYDRADRIYKNNCPWNAVKDEDVKDDGSVGC